ncbi:MAG: LysM peptidoglycan-binding domain-containing protein [Verrucomicrobiae bacterium]|nr:LysM peptidoglycan-binding domain-containing protein [Verrucomicrobiae bacterium]
MSFWRRLIPGAWAAMLLIAVNGCSPAEQSQEDEEKEPHFVLGTSRFNGYEYDGAIEAFQESLEINPHSAQAHYRLAQIYDTKRPDPAAAIYHYQEYLRLDKSAENAETIRERIMTCKQQLAQDVMTMPTAPRTMRQIEDLTETNRLLQAQVERLTDSVKQWSVYAATLQAAAARNNTVPLNNNSTAPPAGGSPTPDDVSTAVTAPAHGTTTASRSSVPHAAQARTHVVAWGETLASIARKHGVSLTALQAANPGVSPRKLRVGQTLNLP